MFRSTGVNGSTEPEPGIHFNLFKLFFFFNETKRQREWGLTRRKEYEKNAKRYSPFSGFKDVLIIPVHFPSVEMRWSLETPIENN